MQSTLIQEPTLRINNFIENNNLLNADNLIDDVMTSGGKIRFYDEDKDLLEEFMRKMLKTTKNNYEDGYSKDIYTNLAIKLNGIMFEIIFSYYCNKYVTRSSSGVFSIEKDYEQGADFTINGYTIAASGTEVPPKPLELKNCIDMESFSKTRKHNSLYVLVNSRSENKIRLLCKLTDNDKLHLSDFEVYDNYKVIKPWFWLNPLIKNYQLDKLGYSWIVSNGVDSTGYYLELISPYLSDTKTIH